LTSFAEDAIDLGIFNYLGNSFVNPPVDYYFHNFASLFDKIMKQTKAPDSYNMCYGPGLGFVTLLDYIQRLALSLPEKRRYFQFVWATSLFHEDPNAVLIGDDHLLRTLKWFEDRGYLETTDLVFMSDHGARYGDIRNTEQVGPSK